MRIFWAFSQAGQARFFGQYDVSLHFITVAREIISVGMHHQRDKLHTLFFLFAHISNIDQVTLVFSFVHFTMRTYGRGHSLHCKHMQTYGKREIVVDLPKILDWRQNLLYKQREGGESYYA